MRKLIINADDLGIVKSTNDAILMAHRDGILTSASLMSNMPAFEDAVENVLGQCPNLGVGLHFCLTSGKSVSPKDKVKTLVDDSGRFIHGFLSLLRQSRKKEFQQEIESELHAQLDKAIDAGVTLDHINSHRHIHMIPAIFQIVTRVAREYSISAIRISREPWPSLRSFFGRAWTLDFHRNWPKNVILKLCSLQIEKDDSIFAAGSTFGILDSGKMNFSAMCRVLNSPWNGVAEIITHPGCKLSEDAGSLSSEDHSFLKSSFRQDEFENLLDPKLRDLVNKTQTKLIDFNKVQTGFTNAVESCHI